MNIIDLRHQHLLTYLEIIMFSIVFPCNYSTRESHYIVAMKLRFVAIIAKICLCYKVIESV